jgi:hypothetical protein
MMKEMGFDMDALGHEGFGDPELDALAKEMGGDDEFAELNELDGMGSDEEESKTPAKKPVAKPQAQQQARKPDFQFDAEM